MNRQLGVLLAIGVTVGVAAVTGAVALGEYDAAPDTEPSSDAPVDGTAILTENETLTLQAADGQVVRGRTDVSPGENVTVRLRSVNEASSPFIRSVEAPVAANGSFRATVDLAHVSDQPEFTVSVRHDGAELATASGRVVGTATEPLDSDPADSDEWERVDRTADEPVANASFVTTDGRLTVPASSQATVRARTDLDPGSELTVRLRSSGGSPFLKQQSATVADDGTVAVTYNMSSVAPGTEVEASVHYDGSELVSRSGTVTEP